MFIVGAGRVGTALVERARGRGASAVLVDREHGWGELGQGDAAIIVAVRNDDLDDVVSRVPPGRRDALVFVQNGMLRDWLRARDLAGATRGLLFFAVPRLGAPIEPGGNSPFCGARAPEVTAWLGSLELPAGTVDPHAFAALELEKLLWNCVFGLLCEAHDAPVGEIVEHYRGEIETLTHELIAVGQPAFGLQLDDAQRRELVERLCRYSASIPAYQGAVKEWPWRNGWFWGASQEPARAMPLHVELLARTGHRPA